MTLEFFIAWRYLKARRRGVFTLLTTLIAIGGITLGVAALIITLGVMTGFHRDIREKILGIQPHLVVLKENMSPFTEYAEVEEKSRKDREVLASAPFVYGQIILRHGNATSGAIVKGIDLAAEEKLVPFARTIVKGEVQPKAFGEGDIILGQELSRSLGVTVGDDVIVMSPGPLSVVPKMERFHVTALFHSGMYEYDANLTYIPIAAAQRLFGLGDAVTGVGMSVRDWDRASEMEASLQNTLSYPYVVRSWERMNHNLFAALKLEKIMMFIILTLIILVAAFNIISNLLLLTVEKTKEIGILSALGIDRLRIGRIFFFEGLIIGVSGISLGMILGTGVSLLLKKYQFIHLPADVYYLDTLPVKLIPGDILSILAATLAITLIAAIYPAYQVTKLDPLEAIRYG